MYSNVPQTSEPPSGLRPVIDSMYYGRNTVNVSTSYMKDGVAYSGIIEHVNADVPDELFDQGFYVVSSNGNLQVAVDFIAHGMIKHQILTKTIDVSGAPTVEIDDD